MTFNSETTFSGAAESVFQRAIIAAAFSPRLIAVLNQAHAFLKPLGAIPIIVHVGEETPEIRLKLEKAIAQSAFRDHPPVSITREGHPADVLIKQAQEQRADLIVAGALQNEGLLRYYIGSIARTVARSAPCSVLLFHDPKEKPRPFAKIHCAVEYDDESRYTAQLAANIAYLSGASDVFYTHSFRMPEGPDQRKTKPSSQEIVKIYSDQDEHLKAFLADLELNYITLQTRTILEKHHASTLHFTRHINADLFVIPGPRHRLALWNRLFPQEIELALQNLPCSLLIARKTIF